MKHALLLLFLVMGPWFLPAQGFVDVALLGPRDRYVENLSDITLDLSFDVQLTNLSTDTVRIQWEKIIVDHPADWVTQVSDEDDFFLPKVKTNAGAPLVLAPGTSAVVSLHVFPLGAAGKGWYALHFAYADLPGFAFESVDFSLTAGNAESLQLTQKSRIRLFPNPATDYFEITPNNLVSEVQVINMVGQPVRSFLYENGVRYGLGGLPAGLYLISLLDEKQGVVKTLRLVKRGVIRP